MDKLSVFLLALCAVVFWFIKSDIDELLSRFKYTNMQVETIKAYQQALNTRLDVKELDTLYELKLLRNKEMLGDTSCGECHNSSDTALPIRKISLNEAINVVRFGNERSTAMGMPIYKSFNNGKDPFITDSGLKTRLEQLYTDELLKTAVNEKYKVSK